MSTKITSGPIWQISLYGISMSGSHRRKFRNLFPPGTMILQIHPLHSSNSRSHTLPSFLQSFMLITSLHFNSEKSIHPPPASGITPAFFCCCSYSMKLLQKSSPPPAPCGAVPGTTATPPQVLSTLFKHYSKSFRL